MLLIHSAQSRQHLVQIVLEVAHHLLLNELRQVSSHVSNTLPSRSREVCRLSVFVFLFLPSRLRANRGDSTRRQKEVCTEKGWGPPPPLSPSYPFATQPHRRGLSARTSGHWPNKRRHSPNHSSHHWPRASHLAHKGTHANQSLKQGTPQHDLLSDTPLATAIPCRTKQHAQPGTPRPMRHMAHA